MAITAQLTPKIFLGSFAATNYLNALEWGVDMDTKDRTTFGDVPYAQYVGSLKTLVCTNNGFNDYAAAAIDEWQRANYGSQQAVSLAYTGEATGNTVVISRGLLGGYRMANQSVGEIPAVALALQGSGTIVAEGQVTQISTGTITANGNTTPVNVGAVSATQSIYAAIHVLSVTGTTPSATFQLASSTTSGGAYTVRGSAGTALTAAGWQWISAAGAFTDTWWRLNVTVSGTTPVFTVFASIAIV